MLGLTVHDVFASFLPSLDKPVTIHAPHVVEMQLRLQIDTVISIVVVFDPLDVLQVH